MNKLMEARKRFIDDAAALNGQIRTHLRELVELELANEDDIDETVLDIISMQLVRRLGVGGAGAILLRIPGFSLGEMRRASVSVMSKLRERAIMTGWIDNQSYLKETLTEDGAIPIELYGSSWTFKRPHMDRESIIFAHTYGPFKGFSGGSPLLVDAHAYASLLGQGFDSLFEWSDEIGGSKPVLLAEHVVGAMDMCGRSFPDIASDELLIVNNSPEAGLLHGATDLVLDHKPFSRVLHRVAVRPGAR